MGTATRVTCIGIPNLQLVSCKLNNAVITKHLLLFANLQVDRRLPPAPVERASLTKGSLFTFV